MTTLIKKVGLTLAVSALVLLPALHQAHADSYAQAEIYYNEACGMCAEYLEEVLVPTLESLGIQDIQIKDYINERSFRKELNQHNDAHSVPLELQSHLVTFINGGDLILGGHVPASIIRDLIENQSKVPANLLIFQDKMDDDVVDYQVWSPGAAVQTYSIDEPISTHLSWYEQNKNNFDGLAKSEQKGLLGLVLLTGLLDGINPCAIAVLIFFIAFLFTLRSSIGRIFKYGIVYIAVIYLTYLGIGFGLFKAIIFTGDPHLMAKIGAWLVILLGLINIIGHYVPKFPIKLQIPKFSQGTLKHWLTKATLPAVIIGAFLVGLCTFPCSGGIYVAIIGLLAARGTFLQGLGYLLIYNVMFVVPLIVLLALAGNKYTLGRVAEWQSKADKGLKFWSGVLMLVLGAIILIWFV